MKTFQIDFVQRPSGQWIAPLLFFVSAVVLLWSWNHFIERRSAAAAAVAAQREAFAQASRPRAPSAEDLKRQEARAQERSALAYPWKDVFDALEAAGGTNVKVVSFTHERAARKSHLVLEGPTFSAIDAAVTQMQRASPANTEWRIDSISDDRGRTGNVAKADVVGSW